MNKQTDLTEMVRRSLTGDDVRLVMSQHRETELVLSVAKLELVSSGKEINWKSALHQFRSEKLFDPSVTGMSIQ